MTVLLSGVNGLAAAPGDAVNVGPSPTGIALGDFTNSGKLSAAVTTSFPGTVEIVPQK